MLITCVENGSCVVTVDVVYDRLFAHEFESFNSKKVCCFEQLHYIVQSDLAVVSVQVSQHFYENVVADFLKANASTCFVCFLMKRRLLEHCREVWTAGEE